LVLFGGGGALMLSAGQLSGLVGVIPGAFFAYATFWTVFSPTSRLRLSAEGFSFATMRAAFKHRWSDVAEFFIKRSKHCVRVGIRFTQRFEMEQIARRSQKGFVRPNRSFPFNYNLPPEKLCALLEEWRIKYSPSNAA